MIRGTVSADGTPTVSLAISDQEWSAIVDTGFNGDLELPNELRIELNAQYVGQVESALAGGQVIEEEMYSVDFPFDGASISAEATFVDGDQILIGTHLLRKYRLTINFVKKSLKLKRIES